MDVCARLFRKRSFCWNRRAANTEPQREVRGGDSGVWKGASKGGNAPITGPFPRPEGTRGTSWKEGEKTERCRLFPRRTAPRISPSARPGGTIFLRSCPPPGNPSDGGPGVRTKGSPCRNFMPSRLRGFPARRARGESRGRKGIKRRPLFPKGTGNGSVKEKASAFAEAFQINLGVVLLSHTRVCSIMGDEELDYRVRNGIGYTLFSMDTKEMSKMYN